MKKGILVIAGGALLFLGIQGCQQNCDEAVKAEQEKCQERIEAVTDSLNSAWKVKLEEAIGQGRSAMRAQAAAQSSKEGEQKTEDKKSTVTDRAGTKEKEKSTVTKRAGAKKEEKSTVTNRAGAKKVDE